MGVNWTEVLVNAGIALPSWIAAVGAIKVVRHVKTPSGEPLGVVAEHVRETTTDTNAKVAEVVDVVKHQ